MAPAVGEIALTKSDFAKRRMIVATDEECCRNDRKTLDSPEKLFSKGFAGRDRP
jgi:hypothetical protein